MDINGAGDQAIWAEGSQRSFSIDWLGLAFSRLYDINDNKEYKYNQINLLVLVNEVNEW